MKHLYLIDSSRTVQPKSCLKTQLAIGYMHIYAFLLRMTDAVASLNIGFPPGAPV
jgi:hypothetical protein